MNSQALEAAGGLTKNLVIFLFIMTIDVFFSCYYCFSDFDSGYLERGVAINDDPKMDTNFVKMFVFYGSGGQVLFQLILLFWYFFLVWKTFLFNYGMIRRLIC